MKERIQKIVAASGLCSRRQAEQWIGEGRVSCNGVVCQIGDTADINEDSICVDGKPIPVVQENIYILLNKPKGFVTTLSDEKGRKTVFDLVQDCGKRVYPVGRLDMDSEGLLILTNDGSLTQKLTHPSHEINKVYRVWVKNFSQAGIDRLLRPMRLDGYLLSVPVVTVIDADAGILQITIHEGRNRQVRRMCAIANMPVKRLVRIQEDNIILGSLPSGKWRYLTPDEVNQLKHS